MSTVEVDDKASVAKSEVSIKTNGPTSPTILDQPHSILKNSRKCLSWTKFITVVWCFLFCAVSSCSLAGFFESAKLSYRKAGLNSTQVVDPPSFLTYLSTWWLLLFYPIQSLSYFIKTEKKIPYFTRLNQSWSAIFPDINMKCRYTFRCLLLLLLWNTLITSVIRASNHIDSIDMVIIFCTNPSIRYLLYWVMMHKKFVALRIVAFLLSASGMIINVYANGSNMWYKVLMSLASVTYSVFIVYARSFLIPKNAEQVSMLYSILALFNTLFTWPIFLFTSIIYHPELITWSYVSWSYFVGCGVSLFVLIISTEISNVICPRGIRNLLFVAAIPLIYLIDVYWLKSHSSQLLTLQTISLVVVLLSMLLTATPSSWLERMSHSVFRKPSPVQQRRLSLASRLHGLSGNGGPGSHLMGNGGMRMSASLNASGGGSQFIGHRDSTAATEMFHKLGSIGSHIFSNHRGRSRMGSIFN